MGEPYGTINLVTVAAAWVGFVALVVARSRGARRRRPLARDVHGSRLMVAQYTLFFGILSHSYLFPWEVSVPALVPAGLVVLGAGMVCYRWSSGTLAAGYDPMVCVHQEQQLVTHGPYRLVRHPLYASQMLMMVGTGVAVQHPVYVTLPLVFGLMFLTARAEERLLARHFEGYAAYSARTPMLLPCPLRSHAPERSGWS